MVLVILGIAAILQFLNIACAAQNPNLTVMGKITIDDPSSSMSAGSNSGVRNIFISIFNNGASDVLFTTTRIFFSNDAGNRLTDQRARQGLMYENTVFNGTIIKSHRYYNLSLALSDNEINQFVSQDPLDIIIQNEILMELFLFDNEDPVGIEWSNLIRLEEKGIGPRTIYLPTDYSFPLLEPSIAP